MYGTATSFTGTYDVVVLNIGGGWNTGSNAFVAPVAGIYYLSYSVGSTVNRLFWWNIIVHSAMLCDNANYAIIVSNPNGLDISSRGCLVNLAANTVVTTAASDAGYGPLGSDSSYGESSFRGFLYSPVQGVKVAWSVHVDDAVSGTLVIPFSVIYVNVGYNSITCCSLPYSASTYTVTIPTDGTYYIELVSQFDFGGPIDMHVTLSSGTVLMRL